MSDRLLIVGGDSEIAAATTAYLRERGHDVIATTRRRELVAADRPFLDLTKAIEDWPVPDGVTAACLCAAIARLNDCARDRAGSAMINVTGTLALAKKLLAQGIPVLFLSTDKVFDGERAYVPADASPCPVSEYGRQKAAAEAALDDLMREGAPAATLRLAKVVMPGMALLREWIAELNGGRPIRAFHDMMMAPTTRRGLWRGCPVYRAADRGRSKIGRDRQRLLRRPADRIDRAQHNARQQCAGRALPHSRPGCLAGGRPADRNLPLGYRRGFGCRGDAGECHSMRMRRHRRGA
jgi:dTDP-4-dehydrorhamnose reductase